MSNKLLLGLVILVGGVLVGWYVLRGAAPKELVPSGGEGKTTVETPAPTTVEGAMGGTTSAAVAGSEKGGVAGRTMVAYTDSGFSPASVTVKVGTTVTFVNNSAKQMWVASAVHPTHQLLPGFDQLKSVGKDGTYEYTFEKVGTWKYHNHVGPSDTGSVVVTQ